MRCFLLFSIIFGKGNCAWCVNPTLNDIIIKAGHLAWYKKQIFLKKWVSKPLNFETSESEDMFIPVLNVLCQAVLQSIFGGNLGLCTNRQAVTNTNESKEDPNSEVEMMSQTDSGYGTQWIFFPDGNGVPQKAYLEDPDMPAGGNTTARSFGFEHLISDAELGDIKFLLYNQDNINTPIRMQIPVDMSRTGFIVDEEYDSGLPTKIIIHGWKSSASSEIGQLIKNAYLEEEDMNVILVDWSAIADKNFYLIPAHHTRDVGRHIARLIDFMVNNEYTDLEDIHLIGHSLGAHTAGYAGHFVKSGKVARITGLDPALPGFKRPNSTSSRLDPTDARFVDVIHTCAGTLGHDENLGHVDFYPNRGRQPQPGCQTDIVGACSHGKSYFYFAQSIGEEGKDYEAYHCSNWAMFKNGSCETKTVVMGDKTPADARGMFFLETE